ncbi:MAG: hypothetical protein D6744_08485 [Planctomycetota bacterium]|nr:MAG: hypothetical protein D6744_08485 [Planctomycetota bacterium]
MTTVIAALALAAPAAAANGDGLSWVESRLKWARTQLAHTEAAIVKVKQQIADGAKELRVLEAVFAKTHDPAVARRIERLREHLSDLRTRLVRLDQRAGKLREMIRYLESLLARG